MSEALLNQCGFQVSNRHVVPARAARYAPCPEALDPRIQEYLESRYEGKLFFHQAEAIAAALRGENVVLATATASGKTLSFAMSVFQIMLANPAAKAMFFYPTKALAGDQLQLLEQMAASVGLGKVVYRFDGDTGEALRRQALRHGRLLIATPDVLHATILRRNIEPEYHAFLSQLAVVVLDESHIYSGAFGSNTAFVLRRLRQVCERKGISPQFIAASATSKNPGKHLEMLTSKTFTVIDETQNGSPHSGREFLMVEPIAEGDDEAVYVFMNHLAEQGRRFIAFCHSRRMAERFYYELVERFPCLKQKVMPYRAGYEIADRRQIEAAFREGTLTGVISTSALELGIDLPGLEYCLHLGLPSTAMSFWQRSGRVGRQPGVVGKIVIVPSGNAIDDYYHRHPEKLYTRPLEELVLHLDNRFLLLSHFACARVESGNFEKPSLYPEIFGVEFTELVQRIDDIDAPDDILISPDPHRLLNVRCIDDATYEIHSGGFLLGTITYSQLLREAYEGAVYRHMGEAYRVTRIKYREQLVDVRPETGSVHTSPMGYIHVKERTGPGAMFFRRTRWVDLVEMTHTAMVAVTSVSGYKEKVGSGWQTKNYPRPLQRRVYSEGVMVRLSPDMGPVTPHGLNALAHALATVYAITKPCDSAEIATHSIIRRTDGTAVLYIFDTTSGGLGISIGVYDSFQALLPSVKELLVHCDHCDADSFDQGCPACIQDPRWYADNERLSKIEALSILNRLQQVLAAQTKEEDIAAAYRNRADGIYTALHTAEGPGEAQSFYGQVLYQAGCQVELPAGMKGRVEAVNMNGNAVQYQILLDNGKLATVRDMGLRRIEGEVEYLCRSCGAVYPDKEAVCLNCFCNLF